MLVRRSVSFMYFGLTLIAACAADAPPGKGGNPGGGNPGGGDPGGGNPGGGSMTATEFVAAMGKHDCDDAFTCKANFPTTQGTTFEQAFGASASACYTDAAGYYNAPAIEAAISKGTIVYDGAAAASCIAGIPAPNCATYWTAEPNWPASCDTAMVGKTADGGACTVDFECSSAQAMCDDTSKKCAPAPAMRQLPVDGAPRRWKLDLNSI
jgi:hypothetical protein